MKINEETYKYGHRNWPWPVETAEEEKVYRIAVRNLVNQTIPEGGPTESALKVFDCVKPQMLNVYRWSNYQVPTMGDMDGYGHSLRQTGITIQAMVHGDARHLCLPPLAQDAMVATAILHDIGEITVGDITYDRKQEPTTKRQLELAEANAVDLQIRSTPQINDTRKNELTEIYVGVATQLDGPETHGSGLQLPWQQMQEQFALYEKYGYFMTAIQQYPYQLNIEPEDLTREELDQLRQWNRPELEAALKANQNVPIPTRRAILFKNVALNQWDAIGQALGDGVPSADSFFNNQLTHTVIKHANRLMALGLSI